MLCHLVDKILDASPLVKELERVRVKRGRIHDEVAGALGVKRSNVLCLIVHERLERRGFRKSVVDGNLFFEKENPNRRGIRFPHKGCRYPRQGAS